MGPPVLVLPHSPVVGPATLEPLARALRELGHLVAVPRMHEAGFESARPWMPWVDCAFEQVSAMGARSLVLVGHSGAGPLLPLLAERVGERVIGLVFLDAGLPPHDGPTVLARPEFRHFLRAIATDGALPPWPEWWEPEVMRQLVPDAELRAAVEAESPRLPLSYFAASVDVPTGWPGRYPAAYARLSAAYDEDAALARERGFPVSVFEGAHLDTVTRPGEVAALVDGIVATLLDGPGFGS